MNYEKNYQYIHSELKYISQNGQSKGGFQKITKKKNIGAR